MTVLGLDLSLTSTGFAVHGLDDAWHIGTFQPKDITGAERLHWLREEIRRLANLDARPRLAVLEGYSFASVSQAHKIGELGGVVRELLYRMDVPYAIAPPASLKKYATGSGTADKFDMIEAARVRAGITFSRGRAREDECDAFWLACAGWDWIGRPLVELPKANRAALAGIDWPGREQVAA